MTDTNEQRIYTEEEAFALFQRFRNEEREASYQASQERALPVEISSILDNFTQSQFQDAYKSFKRRLNRYYCCIQGYKDNKYIRIRNNKMDQTIKKTDKYYLMCINIK
jgi:hypothetical protein